MRIDDAVVLPSSICDRHRALPELLGVGGVQESGRQSASALGGIARKRGWRLQILSLNDPPGEHYLPSDNQIRFRAFGRKKLSLAMVMVRDGDIFRPTQPALGGCGPPESRSPGMDDESFFTLHQSDRDDPWRGGVDTVAVAQAERSIARRSHSRSQRCHGAETHRRARSCARKDPKAGLASEPEISLHG